MNTSLARGATVAPTYYDQVDIYDYDETVVAHPYMDQIKAAMVADLIAVDARANRSISILDAGTGSGQLARAVQGAGFKNVELADIDEHAKAFCAAHPELKHLPFHQVDLTGDLGTLRSRHFDVICMLGVYHHIPQTMRVALMQSLARKASYILIGDEGIAEYSSEAQRRKHAAAWYGSVISEAKRRRIEKLARLEELFFKSDVADQRGSEEDFKESPSIIAGYCKAAGLSPQKETRLGDWAANKGGMYCSLFRVV